MNSLPFLHTLLIVCPLVFLAGFIDSIAGGGGVISLPAYLAAGLPPHLAAGTNKCSAMFGTSVAAVRYRMGGHMRAREAALAAAMALPGAWLGTRIALALDPDVLRGAMLVVIPLVAVFMALRGRKNAGEISTEGIPDRYLARHPDRRRTARAIGVSLTAAIGFGIGLYDGLIGPGTGTFLILAFGAFLGRTLVVSSGNAKLVNLASNVASGILFFLSGKVWIALAIPAACCTIAGGWLGSHLAVKNGAKVIRPVLFVVLAILFAKIALDLLGIL